jgi:spore germination protein GerM
MKQHQISQFAKELILGISTLLLLVLGVPIWWVWQMQISPQVEILTPSAKPPQVEIPTPSAKSSQVEIPTPSARLQPTELQPQVYWLQIVNNKVQLVPQVTHSQPDNSPELALKSALNDLFQQGSPNSELTTTIPAGTRLLSMRMTETGIYVDLSREFSQGGGTTSMVYRVAQVLYTVTSLDYQAKVFLSVEGQPLDEDYPLGGEGLILRYPLTRQEFTEDFSLS